MLWTFTHFMHVKKPWMSFSFWDKAPGFHLSPVLQTFPLFPPQPCLCQPTSPPPLTVTVSLSQEHMQTHLHLLHTHIHYSPLICLYLTVHYSKKKVLSFKKYWCVGAGERRVLLWGSCLFLTFIFWSSGWRCSASSLHIWQCIRQ